MAICIFYSNLVDFMAIWYILWPFGILFGDAKKNLATLAEALFSSKSRKPEEIAISDLSEKWVPVAKASRPKTFSFQEKTGQVWTGFDSTKRETAFGASLRRLFTNL
jgi:hypothetical protein